MVGIAKDKARERERRTCTSGGRTGRETERERADERRVVCEI